MEPFTYTAPHWKKRADGGWYRPANEEAEILPCPWCGSKAIKIGDPEQKGYVRCTNQACRADGPWCNDAIAAWNRFSKRLAAFETLRETVREYAKCGSMVYLSDICEALADVDATDPTKR